MQELSIPSELKFLEDVSEFVLKAAQAANLGEDATYKLRLAVDEIATNIILHGYHEAGENGQLVLEARLDEQSLTIRLEDTARPYDPRLAHLPDTAAPLEQRKVGGLGVHFALNAVDRFHYERVGDCNRNIFVMLRS
jgi:serine/threonine-protein kinase RsbW